MNKLRGVCGGLRKRTARVGIEPVRFALTLTMQAIEITGKFGAGNEVRTRDLDLGKVALYQLSYTRLNGVP